MLDLKKLSESQDQTICAVSKKGEESYTNVTADEISKKEEIIHGFSQEDAHMVGFTVATEQLLAQEKQQEKLKKQLKDEKTQAKLDGETSD